MFQHFCAGNPGICPSVGHPMTLTLTQLSILSWLACELSSALTKLRFGDGRAAEIGLQELPKGF